MPKMIIPDKICPHCGGNIWLVYRQKEPKCVLGYYMRYVCRECRNKALKKAYKKDKTNFAKRVKKWQEKNTQKVLEDTKKYRRSKRGLSKSRKRKQRYIKTLHDGYLKDLIVNDSPLSYTDIPNDLLTLKRKQLCLKRKVGQLKKSVSKQPT